MSASEAPALADLARQGDAPPFAAPWEAQAFALAVHLHERGAFTWAEWTEVFARELAAQASGDHPKSYYECWVAALERLALDRRLAGADALSGRKEDWAQAYRRTPHGQPVRL